MTARRTKLAAAALLLVAAIAGACSSGGDDASDAAAMQGADEGGSGGSEGAGGARRLADTGTQFSAAQSSDATTQEAELPEVDLVAATPERVIKTASLQLEVEDGELARAMRRGREIAEAAGGFVLSTAVDGVERRTGDFTVRIPAGEFEATLSALEELGTVAYEDVTGRDVTQEFVDLEARLRNATAQEEVLFRLYDRATSIADTIRVQRELEDVQLEIERLRGRLRFLEDRTDFSTISVGVTEAGAVTAEAGPFERAWQKARDTFVAVVSGAIVGAGFLLPLAALALAAYLVFRLVRPRVRAAS
ncbi:MAG TPA: DUF4349 domain-containing protein [Actinomycetota bacterium]|nr:DUF4349 domain-containing protein [Actinomycetota bacterium]